MTTFKNNSSYFSMLYFYAKLIAQNTTSVQYSSTSYWQSSSPLEHLLVRDPSTQVIDVPRIGLLILHYFIQWEYCYSTCKHIPFILVFNIYKCTTSLQIIHTSYANAFGGYKPLTMACMNYITPVQIR